MRITSNVKLEIDLNSQPGLQHFAAFKYVLGWVVMLGFVFDADHASVTNLENRFGAGFDIGNAITKFAGVMCAHGFDVLKMNRQ